MYFLALNNIQNIHSASVCSALNTETSFITSIWNWTSPSTVVFGTGNGLSTEGIYQTSTTWYEYNTSSNFLQKLSASPYKDDKTAMGNINGVQNFSLANIEPGENGVFEGIHISPDGTKAIFPHKGDKQTYWVTDITGKFSVDSGIAASDTPKRDDINAFWFSHNTQLILQSGPNNVSPILLVLLGTTSGTVQHLAEIKPWSLYQPAYEQFTVAGVSSDGKYIISQPATPNLWLYIAGAPDFISLDFHLLGDLRIAWKNASEFIALTNRGVISYNILNNNYVILKTISQLNLTDDDDSRDSLSPDGKYLLVQHNGANGVTTADEIDICTII